MGEQIDEAELFKNSIKYLHHLSTVSALNNVPALESIFTTKRRIIEGRTSTFLPHSVSKMNNKCQRCLLNFSDGPANYKIMSKMKKHKFAKKISAKLKNNSPLTKYQKRYLKSMSDFKGNQLVTTCKFCKKEHFMKMSLPKTHKKPNVPVNLPKKKKNKKDKFSGLNQEAVISSTPQNDRNLNNSEIKKKENDNTKTKLKMSKSKQRPLESPIIIIEDSTEKIRRKQKKKNLDKLNNLLNNAITKKTKSPSGSLKHFLQSL